MEEESIEEDYLEEKGIKDLPKLISYETLLLLGKKMETQICKIQCSENEFGTGFFCNIQYGFNSLLKTLITNYHVLKENDLLPGKKIEFTINNDKVKFEIKIDKLRKIYTSKKYDISIIELKQNDKLDGISFFDIDNEIFSENSKEIYRNKQIYLLQYPKGDKMGFSNGIIKYIKDNNYTIKHLCNTTEGSSGGPIINSNNFQVIGIHKGGGKNEQFNLGTFFKLPIKEFIEVIKINYQNSEKINEIINNEKKKDLMVINNDEIVLKYVNKINHEIKMIFGKNFVKNNRDKCKIIFKGEEIELCTDLETIDNNEIEIKLKGISNITDMSYMFAGCMLISSLPDISQWNTQNVTNMSHLFSGCESLLSLPDISNWNTQNVRDMSFMFFDCKSLLYLPDISNWNTQNVINMSNMFFDCQSLLYLPDISNWNTQNVRNMEKMFDCCNKQILNIPKKFLPKEDCFIF